MICEKMRHPAICCTNVVFMPALTPFEASVLPAKERETYGVLGIIPHAYEAGRPVCGGSQRAKIWVR